MADPIKAFGETATSLSKNPLGIIALFIVLVYGFAAFVTTSSSMAAPERTPLIYFLVLFPVLVFGVFALLVIFFPTHLYAPGDYRNEENYVAIAASLAAATVRNPNGSAQRELDVRGIVETVRGLGREQAHHKTTWQKRLLWVDDRPENNVFERQAFEQLGLSFTLALSTSEALELLRTNKYAAIISDMGRKEGPREGYKLLDAVRQSSDNTPFFIYAGSNLPEHKREAASHDAQGSTNDARELFEMVTAAVL